jgi:ATPase subunit of ABC transporter with duplicated ATPase domains
LDRTIEVADGDIALYEGGYSAYLEQKAAVLAGVARPRMVSV